MWWVTLWGGTTAWALPVLGLSSMKAAKSVSISSTELFPHLPCLSFPTCYRSPTVLWVKLTPHMRPRHHCNVITTIFLIKRGFSFSAERFLCSHHRCSSHGGRFPHRISFGDVTQRAWEARGDQPIDLQRPENPGVLAPSRLFVVVTSPWRGQLAPRWRFRADQGTEWRISQNTASFVKILIYVNGAGYFSSSRTHQQVRTFLVRQSQSVTTPVSV